MSLNLVHSQALGEVLRTTKAGLGAIWIFNFKARVLQFMVFTIGGVPEKWEAITAVRESRLSVN